MRTEFSASDFEQHPLEDWDLSQEPIRPFFRVTPREEESTVETDTAEELFDLYPTAIQVDGVEYKRSATLWDMGQDYAQYTNPSQPEKVYEIIGI